MTKEIKIQFAPGCFDNFDGTQEELDAMVADIQKMFEGKTPEELEAMSRPISIDELLEDETISDDEFENILEALVNTDNVQKRKLQ